MNADTPGVSRRRATIAVIVGLLVTGVPVGALWAWLAPAVHGVVALTRDGDRVHDYLGNESEHFFVAAFVMLGLLNVVAVIAAVLVWQWRAHRGPAMVFALCIGTVCAAAAAAAVGALLVHLHYGTVDFDAAPVTEQNRVYYFTQAPPVFFGQAPLQVACTLLLPAATAALVYAVLAAATARDDLGGHPAVEPPAPESVTADVGAPSVR
jgi:MFS family permease